MHENRLGRSAILAVIMCFVLLITLTSATLAWFTSTRKVETSRVTGRTAEEDAALEISSRGGAEFSGSEEANIVWVNSSGGSSEPQGEYKVDKLMPVSTAELANFVKNTGVNAAGEAVSFVKASDGDMYYYHGRVFLRATLDESFSEKKLAIYFDGTSETNIKTIEADGESLLLNAARLGFVFDNDPATFRIFSLSNEHNQGEDSKLNTRLNGVELGAGMVIDSSGGIGNLRAVSDPAIDYSDFTAYDTGAMPTTPIFRLEDAKIHQLDIYFYLEGCDPDCTDAIALDAGFLQLAFLGVPDEGGE